MDNVESNGNAVLYVNNEIPYLIGLTLANNDFKGVLLINETILQ